MKPAHTLVLRLAPALLCSVACNSLFDLEPPTRRYPIDAGSESSPSSAGDSLTDTSTDELSVDAKDGEGEGIESDTTAAGHDAGDAHASSTTSSREPTAEQELDASTASTDSDLAVATVTDSPALDTLSDAGVNPGTEATTEPTPIASSASTDDTTTDAITDGSDDSATSPTDDATRSTMDDATTDDSDDATTDDSDDATTGDSDDATTGTTDEATTSTTDDCGFAAQQLNMSCAPEDLCVDVVCPLNGVCVDGECTFNDALSVLALERGEGGFTLDDPTDLCAGLGVDVVGDLNADGKLDFSTTGLYGGHIVFGGTHNASLDLSDLGNNGLLIANSEDPNAVDGPVGWSGDINGDGRPDLAVYQGDAISGILRVLFTPETPTDIELADTGLAGFTIQTPTNAPLDARGAGDVNADGKDDLLVWVDAEAFVVFGKQSADSVTIPELQQELGLTLNPPEGATSATADRAGDFNKDGKRDVILGYHEASIASVIFGRTATWPTISVASPNNGGVVISGATELGKLVSPAGDFNGDTYEDVLVGTGEQTWVIFGGLGSAAVDVANLGSAGIRIDGESSALAPAGDVNGDGYADIIVGNGSYGPDFEGIAYVVFGSPDVSNLTLESLGTRGQRIPGFRSDDNVGNSVSGGDIDGDGFSDLVIGSSCPEGGRSEVYVVYGMP